MKALFCTFAFPVARADTAAGLWRQRVLGAATEHGRVSLRPSCVWQVRARRLHCARFRVLACGLCLNRAVRSSPGDISARLGTSFRSSRRRWRRQAGRPAPPASSLRRKAHARSRDAARSAGVVRIIVIGSSCCCQASCTAAAACQNRPGGMRAPAAAAAGACHAHVMASARSCWWLRACISQPLCFYDMLQCSTIPTRYSMVPAVR